MGRSYIKSKKSPKNSKIVGGNGYVLTASVLFKAPHPWYRTTQPGYVGVKPGDTGGLIEISAGFFSWSKDNANGGGGGKNQAKSKKSNKIKAEKDTGISQEVIIVYQIGKRPLRLRSSHLLSASPPSVPGGKLEYNDKNSSMISNDMNSKEYESSSLNIECARESPLSPHILSHDLNIAVNPQKHVDLHEEESRNKDGNNHHTRQGLRIEIYKYPCRIHLK